MNRKMSPGQFNGQILKRREVAAFTLSESTYLPDTRLPEHSHPRSYICILLQGTYTERYGHRTRECRPSTVVFHPPGEVHENHFLNEGGRLFRSELDHDCLKRIRECSGALSDPVEHTGGSSAWLATRLYKEFRCADRMTPLVVEGLILEIAAELSRLPERSKARQPPRWLGRGLEMIRDRLDEDLELRTIAASVGVHPVHFARVFRKFHGCTAGEYIRSLRVEVASRRLAASEASLAEIAIGTGFADQSHFSKSFKQATGWTPGQFRAAFRPCSSETRRFTEDNTRLRPPH
jgi:AraC family transcriptional regulator